jgi:hypothetical protein
LFHSSQEKEIFMLNGSLKKNKIKVMTASLALFMTFGLALPNRFASLTHAFARTCINVISGNGAEGTTDSVVKFLNDSNVYQNAFIIPPHVDNDGQPPDTNYAVIPGTHYVAVTVDGHGQEQADHKFRATFNLPASFTNPSFSIQVHCDNQATIFLNGNLVGSQIFAEDIVNFQNPAEVFTDNNASHFVPGLNVLDITAHNFTDRIALDFKADICYDSGCRDEDPPSVRCSVNDSQLWPANHDLKNVGLSAVITDDCDCHHNDGDDDDDDDDDDDHHGGHHGSDHSGGGNGGGGDCDDDHNDGHGNTQSGQTAVQVIVYSDEPDLDIPGSGNFSPDAKNIGLGTLRLRAERSGTANGRVYLIVVKATDQTGKTGYCAKTVTVPKDQSRASKDSVESQATAARTFYLSNHTPPAGYVQVGNGPVVGPKQ